MKKIMKKNSIVNSDKLVNYGYIYNKQDNWYVYYNEVSHDFDPTDKTISYFYCQNCDHKKILNMLIKFKAFCVYRDNVFYRIIYYISKWRKITIINVENLFDQELKSFFSHIWGFTPEYTYYYLIKETQKFIYMHTNMDIVKKKYLSLTSISYKIFQHKFCKSSLLKFRIGGRLHENIRKSFFGGRCDIFLHTYLNEHYCNIYDFNSFYPWIMRNFPMPIGRPVIHELGHTSFNKQEIDNLTKTYFGFAKIAFKYKENCIPVLPLRINDKSIFGKRSGHGIYFSEEIKLALEMGYEIKYITLYAYGAEVIFKDFVNYFYPLKSNSILTKKLVKLLLNKCYGAFAIRRDYSLSKVELLEEEPFIDDNIHCELDEHIDGFLIKKPVITEHHRNIAIASAISSYGRIELYKLLLKFEKHLIYCDTDSIFLTCHLNVNDTDTLGFLKKVNKQPIIDFVLVSPKFYALKYKDNSSALVIKGYSEKDLYWSFDEIKTKFIFAVKHKINHIILTHKSKGDLTLTINNKRKPVLTRSTISTETI